MKKLVIYYSQARGNTKRIAEKLAVGIGAEIERFDTIFPYEGTYQEIVDQGQDEINRGFEPEIKTLSKNIADYDLICIGTPTWWYTMAPAVKTLLSGTDFSGKKVVLFQTHGGWPGHALDDMKKLLQGAEVVNEQQIQFDSDGGDRIVTPESELDVWIQQINSLQ